MNIPLHTKLNDPETPASAWAKYGLWHAMMSRNPKGFRQPIGTGSKRVKPRQGWGIRKNEGGCFPYLNGLQFVMKYGERNA